jgi:phosphatidylserine/phosphatidylglycerophosphate/cardiolipin synthase-like enzyme
MAKKTRTNNNRTTLTMVLSIIILGVAILGALNVIDTTSLDDALEPYLGVRIFMTEPRPPEMLDTGGDSTGSYFGDSGTVFNDVVSSGPWWSVYFTSPGNPENFIANELVARINAAKNSIHIAAFEFDLEQVAEALIAAEKRGVEVLWVTDDEYGIEADQDDGLDLFDKMKSAGVGVRDDQRGGLMHNKFFIFDQEVVWTGSTNITSNGTLLNNNNVVAIDSRELAAIYEREFQEMWSEGQFGPSSPSTADLQNVKIDDSLILVRFAPEDEVANLLADLLGKARTEVRFLAFSFTDDDMGGTLLQKSRSGVNVAGIFETRGSETQYSEFSLLYCAGVPVRQDGNPRTMHHKVFIIDRQIVVTGSYNFSSNADNSNDENLIIIDNSEIANQYLQEFDRLWAESLLPAQTEISCP